MQRREFLAMIGVVTVGAVCVRETWAIQNGQFDQNASEGVTDAVSFKRYHGRIAFDLLRDRRFRSYIQGQFPGVHVPFDHPQRVLGTICYWMTPGRVTVAHNRFLIITGNMNRVAADRGMLWVDATHPMEGGNAPLVVASFLTREQGNKVLWIIPNQQISNLSSRELPHHFTMTMSRWIRSRKPLTEDRGFIEKVIVYEPATQPATPLMGVIGIKHYRTTANAVAVAIDSQTVAPTS